MLLRLPFSADFLALAMAFVDKGARGSGYGDREAQGLVLAVEELFSFYEQQAAKGSIAEIEMEDQGYRLALSISFCLANPDMQAFNLTWNVNHDSEESLKMLGPMIAARTLSSLRLEFGDKEKVILRLTRNREYRSAEPVLLPPSGSTSSLRVTDPSREEIYHFASMAATYGSPFLPLFLAHPEMAADMLETGHLHALLVVSDDWIMGGVLWKPLTNSCLELYGPYLFIDDPEDAAMNRLMDEAVKCISRSRFKGLVRRQGALADHERFFDLLGEIQLSPNNNVKANATYYYRQLREESSGVVYCSGHLAAFLDEQYRRLCLPRQIRTASSQRLRNASVLAVELENTRSLAIIRPLCAGKDMATNLNEHLDLLQGEGIENFIVELDTGRREEIAFADALEKNSFIPRLLIPDAGIGDLVIYEHSNRDLQP